MMKTENINTGFSLIGPFSQLITMASLPDKGAIRDEEITVLENAALLVKDDIIYCTGSYDTLKKEAKALNAVHVPLTGKYVCVPGFVDAHTHICFAGTRSNDYRMRNAGKTYLEISATGGGIWDTVNCTRKAEQEELVSLTVQRAERHLAEGVTTIEVKSGYGLSVEQELKMLRAIQQAGENTRADLVATCLAAHISPKDAESPTAYLNMITETLFPIIKNENLCNRIDAFIEENAFGHEDIKPYLKKAKEMGFDITIHADQFTCGGSALAVEFQVLSADHLEASTAVEIEMLAKSEVIAVALPGASIGLGCKFPFVRKMLDAGLAVAIASDWNPGSAPIGDLLCTASILGAFEKLSNAEVLAGITYRAALALGLKDRGKLEAGMLADFNLFETNSYHEIFYHQGKLKPKYVYKRGQKNITPNSI
ncbi:imidazolonepropionase [Chryseobacterium sp. G0186]|uniref:imidazolonepropionase n=1 Tax=Chryseobacterium sp. G0186 TaxID=2487064 RepID=UPI000F504C21|nr:imidazolonepropionase [Chryseobacterium sp. G0186]AZA77293.1 imidazolonepropionase [Chryseobacterium sp. G0186]